MTKVPEALREFVFRRIVESAGGWEDRQKKHPTEKAALAYINWLTDCPYNVSPVRYTQEKAFEWRSHPAYRWGWAPASRRRTVRIGA